MNRASRFVVSPNWKVLISDLGVDPSEVLIYAKLPADIFNQEDPTLSPEEYYRFWEGLDKACGDQELGLLLSESLSTESFSPPIFASLCSPNLNTALARIQEYKPLIGPLVLDIRITENSTLLTISCYDYAEAIPSALALGELVFFTQLARIATREEIKPVAITLPLQPNSPADYESYFGCKLEEREALSIEFSAVDASRPFLTSNAQMWEFFEDNLKQRLKDLDSTATTVDRVCAVLIESLPSGESSIDEVSKKLGMSKRTLQRKLTEEAETYQSLLQHVRTELADHYLKKSQLSLGEISFMLGFRESNSFIRAYSSWKGISPGQYRERL